ncbi:hypothetical protein SKAU_G00384040 [Synaphobranchus kaupii]|uniref:Uncharacterized protein n=1 Tax=Synaphobranchus kaupii TaxID=118154 RepID=A0A9Q1IEY9_SYNKA|nr:hypothetical protein SKAU_G00384040 [Synaphobranchus kaupii]
MDNENDSGVGREVGERSKRANQRAGPLKGCIGFVCIQCNFAERALTRRAVAAHARISHAKGALYFHCQSVEGRVDRRVWDWDRSEEKQCLFLWEPGAPVPGREGEESENDQVSVTPSPGHL